MGLPFWEMPDHLDIGGVRCPINTDFRVGIRIRQMIWDPYYHTHRAALSDGIRRLLFCGRSPACCDETAFLAAVIWYLLDGRVSAERILRRLLGGEPGEAVSYLSAAAEPAEPVFSYLWDTPALYAAFLETYRVDLLTAQMHLWQFDALFAALPGECALCRTMSLRCASVDEAADADDRAALAARKLTVHIPDTEELHRLYFCAAQDGGHARCSFAKQE